MLKRCKSTGGLGVLSIATEAEARAKGARVSRSKAELDEWLDNMIIDHRYTADEVREATGLELAQAEAEVRQRGLKTREPLNKARVLPYPGGRHPRRGFLDGAIEPQRETKMSIFAPWPDGGYVVVDVPEAVFSNLGLTYLAHTHIPTIWDKFEQPLARLEWSRTAEGYSVRRKLPNGIQLASFVTGRDDGADMRIELTNGTTARLSGLRVQVCTMLKGAVGFNGQQPLESIVDGPTVAIRGLDNREQPTQPLDCNGVDAQSKSLDQSTGALHPFRPNLSRLRSGRYGNRIRYTAFLRRRQGPTAKVTDSDSRKGLIVKTPTAHQDRFAAILSWLAFSM